MSITKNLGCDHFGHDHDYELQDSNKPFPCSGCKEPGFGPRYKCKSCHNELHKECRFPKSTLHHDFFEGSAFEFFEKPQTRCGKSHCEKHYSRCCDACGKDVRGYAYHDRVHGWDLHPCCGNLEDRLTIDGTTFELRKKGASRCEWCKRKRLSGSKSHIPGWSYVSGCGEYRFHVYCVTEMVHEAWKNGDIDGVNAKALEKMDLGLMVRSKRGGRRGSKFWVTMKFFLKAILLAGVLVGDPTMILASVLVELISK